MLTLLFSDFSNASINGISGNYETVALLIFKLFFYDTVRTWKSKCNRGLGALVSRQLINQIFNRKKCKNIDSVPQKERFYCFNSEIAPIAPLYFLFIINLIFFNKIITLACCMQLFENYNTFRIHQLLFSCKGNIKQAFCLHVWMFIC